MAGPRLHVGAFDVVHEGWLNTDVTPHLMVARVPWVARAARALGRLDDERWAAYEDGRFRALRYLDVTRPLPFGDDVFEAALGSHVLEHLAPDEGAALLAELRRVLAPGGVLRIAVPDLDAVIAAYDPADPDGFLDGLLQGRTRSRSRHRHWWHYNERSLRAAFEGAGFVDVRREGFRRGRCPDVERVDTRPESLFMEGVVP